MAAATAAPMDVLRKLTNSLLMPHCPSGARKSREGGAGERRGGTRAGDEAGARQKTRASGGACETAVIERSARPQAAIVGE